MSADDVIPRLRMAAEPAESPERIARGVEREEFRWNMRREDEMTGSLAPYRVASVPYLNAAPLTRGIEDQIQFLPPSRLAELLKAGELDAALLSITEVFFSDAYDVLDGIAIASMGEVYSVVLAHEDPLDEMREVFVDPASCTSVNLLRVLLAERGLHPEFKTLDAYANAPQRKNVLLIGDRAIDFRRAHPDRPVWDLGAAWNELTGLPFAYAVWALRRDRETTALRRRLREAKAFGMDTLEQIIQMRPEYDRDFRQDYLGWHIHYHLTGDEKRGVAKFLELLRKHSGREVFEPRYVA